MRCQTGKSLYRKQLRPHQHQIICGAVLADCSVCTLKARCTNGPRRFVARHLHEAALQRMRARATPE